MVSLNCHHKITHTNTNRSVQTGCSAATHIFFFFRLDFFYFFRCHFLFFLVFQLKFCQEEAKKGNNERASDK